MALQSQYFVDLVGNVFCSLLLDEVKRSRRSNKVIHAFEQDIRDIFNDYSKVCRGNRSFGCYIQSSRSNFFNHCLSTNGDIQSYSPCETSFSMEYSVAPSNFSCDSPTLLPMVKPCLTPSHPDNPVSLASAIMCCISEINRTSTRSSFALLIKSDELRQHGTCKTIDESEGNKFDEKSFCPLVFDLLDDEVQATEWFEHRVHFRAAVTCPSFDERFMRRYGIHRGGDLGHHYRWMLRLALGELTYSKRVDSDMQEDNGMKFYWGNKERGEESGDKSSDSGQRPHGTRFKILGADEPPNKRRKSNYWSCLNTDTVEAVYLGIWEPQNCCLYFGDTEVSGAWTRRYVHNVRRVAANTTSDEVPEIKSQVSNSLHHDSLHPNNFKVTTLEEYSKPVEVVLCGRVDIDTGTTLNSLSFPSKNVDHSQQETDSSEPIIDIVDGGGQNLIFGVGRRLYIANFDRSVVCGQRWTTIQGPSIMSTTETQRTRFSDALQAAFEYAAQLYPDVPNEHQNILYFCSATEVLRFSNHVSRLLKQLPGDCNALRALWYFKDSVPSISEMVGVGSRGNYLSYTRGGNVSRQARGLKVDATVDMKQRTLDGRSGASYADRIIMGFPTSLQLENAKLPDELSDPRTLRFGEAVVWSSTACFHRLLFLCPYLVFPKPTIATVPTRVSQDHDSSHSVCR